MSALEKYRNLLRDARSTQTGRIHIHPRRALDAADAAIAELEASERALIQTLDAMRAAVQSLVHTIERDRREWYAKPSVDRRIAELGAEKDGLLLDLERISDEREQIEAELVERDRMLRLAEERVIRVLPTFSPTTAKLIRKVFADLRARAKEGSET